MGLIALTFGLVVIFGGYRLFLVLLPIWGFFVGFYLGAQTIQIIFDVGFLITITSWVVGFIVGAIFAVLSYLFYIFAVAVLSFSFGYGLTVGILEWIGLDLGLIVWIIAVIVGVVVALAVIRFNLQKYAIIVVTSLGGTGVVIYTLLALFGNVLAVVLLENPVKLAIDNSFWWLLFFIVLGLAGIIVQIQANRSFEIETYNRLEESTV
jgi:hypothetical protein